MDDVQDISALKVMKSAAGYYVGRTYRDEESGRHWPYSRTSHYFADAKEAAEHAEAIAPEEGDLDESVSRVLEGDEGGVAVYG